MTRSRRLWWERHTTWRARAPLETAAAALAALTAQPRTVACPTVELAIWPPSSTPSVSKTARKRCRCCEMPTMVHFASHAVATIRALTAPRAAELLPEGAPMPVGPIPPPSSERRSVWLSRTHLRRGRALLALGLASEGEHAGIGRALHAVRPPCCAWQRWRTLRWQSRWTAATMR